MLTTQLACGKARKCMAACPQAFANPASLLHGHPVSAVGRQAPHHYLSSLHTSGPGVSLPGETRGKWGPDKRCRHEDLGRFSGQLHPSSLPSPGNLGEKRHVEMVASCKTNQVALQT